MLSDVAILFRGTTTRYHSPIVLPLPCLAYSGEHRSCVQIELFTDGVQVETLACGALPYAVVSRPALS